MGFRCESARGDTLTPLQLPKRCSKTHTHTQSLSLSLSLFWEAFSGLLYVGNVWKLVQIFRRSPHLRTNSVTYLRSTHFSTWT
jgi:hypothetical protein